MKQLLQLFAMAAGLALLCPLSGFSQEKSAERPWRKIQLNKDYTSEGICCGDFNRDGKTDIVAGPYWYEGPDFQKKHRIFQPVAYDPHGYSATTQPCYVGDFNGDGWADVLYVVREADGWNLVWYENPAGKHVPWKKHPALKGVWNESPVWGDIEGNGRPAFLTHHDGAVGYATYDASRPDALWTFHAVSPPVPYRGPVHGIGLGDIAGHGRKDLVTSDGWRENPGKAGGPWVFHPFRFAEAGAQMFVYDVDGDGLSDVITVWNAHRYGLVWWKQVRNDKGAIAWKVNEILPRNPDLHSPALRISQMHALALADLNGDGLQGLVTGKRFWAHGPTGDVEPDRPAVVYWFQLRRDGKGGVQFIPHPVDGDSGVGTQITAVDLRGDGLLDILTSNEKGTYIHTRTKVRTPTPRDLKGIWRLQSVETPLPGGGTEFPFGRQPTGSIIYMHNGSMAVHIAGSDKACGKFMVYAADWHIAGECVVHDVKESLDPKLRGVRLQRRAELDPLTGILTYRTVEKQGPGCPVVRWQKAE